MEYSYEINDEIKDNDRNLTIVDREIRTSVNNKHIQRRKWYKCLCNKCGYIFWNQEYNIKQGHGCGACCRSPQIIVPGINDIATTDAWMLPYLANANDATKYSKSSGSKIDFKCPNCGSIRKMGIDQFYRRKIVPCICLDSISFPNKYLYSLLSQLNLNFIPEKKFEWGNNRKYDQYIEYNGKKIIVEINGKQHYDKCFIKSKSRYRTVEEEQQNDIYKYELAMSHGIDYYFVIDARKSDSDYIRNNILDSGLLETLDVSESDIDWNKCSEFAVTNFMKTVCDYKNNHEELTLTEIASHFKLHRDTVYSYVKIGTKLGWCSYAPHDDRKRPNKKNRKPLYCITTDTYYDSSISIKESYNVVPALVNKSIRDHVPYKGKLYSYISKSEFNNMKDAFPDKVVGDYFSI